MNEPLQTALSMQKPQVLNFQFHGKAGEFFRIWIVNLCLTIVTLGIYSAWAKVRTHQYFYGHTTLGGSSFEYTAQPMQILKGRLIAFGLFILYQLIIKFFPLAALPMMLIFAAIVPWIIVRSMMFRHFHTRYRNIRFGFDGGYIQALIAYVLLPLGSVFTAGLLYPYAACRQQRWLANYSRFGDAKMSAELKAGAFYSIYLSALFLIISSGVLFFLVQTSAPSLLSLLPLVILPFYYVVYAYIKVHVANLTLNNLHLAEHRFESRMKTLAYLWIFISNTLAIILTLGLATPWAMIRSANYRAACTSALVLGDLDQFVQAQQEQQNAFGEELGDTLDLEFGV